MPPEASSRVPPIEPRIPWRMALVRPVDLILALVTEDATRYRFVAPALAGAAGVAGLMLMDGRWLMALGAAAMAAVFIPATVFGVSCAIAVVATCLTGQADFGRTWSVMAWTTTLATLALAACGVVLVFLSVAVRLALSAMQASPSSLEGFAPFLGFVALVGPMGLVVFIASRCLAQLRGWSAWAAVGLLLLTASVILALPLAAGPMGPRAIAALAYLSSVATIFVARRIAALVQPGGARPVRS